VKEISDDLIMTLIDMQSLKLKRGCNLTDSLVLLSSKLGAVDYNCSILMS